MSDAFSRFKQKLEYLKTASPQPEPKPKPAGIIELPQEWEKAGAYSFRKIVKKSLPHELCESLRSAFEYDDIRDSDLVFFDLETTGLSGGAGTIAFLVGFATIENDCMVVEQRFLSDYPGEKEFLEGLASIFTPDKTYVSYNGKGFDEHLLRTRFTMNGMRISMENQIDLLYLSRRFWKRVLSNCSLSEIERAILSKERTNDIPGYLIPDAYFDFQRTKNASDMLRVFAHNEIDIVTLVELFALIRELTTKGSEALYGRFGREIPVDKTALGEFLVYRNSEQGMRLLVESFANGDMRAGKILGTLYKRSREWDSAVRLWEAMWKSSKDPWAALELSKYFEHTMKNYDTALYWAERIACSCASGNGERGSGFAKRIQRIKRRIELEKKGDHIDHGIY